MLLPFDKIFVLSLVETPERLENFYREIEPLNIENKISVWHACYHPYVKDIAWYLKNNNKFIWNGCGNGNAFNCAREHYNIIKYAYYSNLNSILIFEDDMQFKSNIEDIKELFQTQLPNDWSIIKYAHYGYKQVYNTNESKYKLENKNSKDWGTACYALSRKGMKYYIDYIERTFCVADYPLFDADRFITGVYTCEPTIFAIKNKFNSTIQ